MTYREPSLQQQDIFDAIAAGDHNICVDAKAGCAKTTTIVEGVKFVPKVGYVSPSKVFLAFNKGIAETLKQRLPNDALSSTFHALGFRALKESNILDRRVKVDSGKCRWLLYDLLDKENEDFRNILRLVSLLKGGHHVSYNDIDINALTTLHNLEFDQPDKAIHLALMVLRKSDEITDRIDFDDMLHMAILFNARFEPRDWIFVDEAQDLNSIQHEIVRRLMIPYRDRINQNIGNPGVPGRSPSRLVAVGDPHQAIYGFRGALSDSMSTLATEFNMKTYPLSVSYRCPKAVVREANKYLRS